MSQAEGNASVLFARNIRKSFQRETGEMVHALDGVSLEVRNGTLTAVVGPDGAGKTTLIRLAAGLMTADEGELRVIGTQVAANPQYVQSHIGYMPQKFGLYEDLTVLENLDLYAELHGVTAKERLERYPRLMEMTALGPFTERLAGRLSGGMKQKLGLACTLVRPPRLLLLDEPTVGVDPLSRRELWRIILKLVEDQGLTVFLSTSYLDEAERCEHVIVLHQGKVLAAGAPVEVSNLAAGRTFLADPPASQTARTLQARLLDDPHVVDAVPEGGRVRFVLARDGSDCARIVEKEHLSSIPAPVDARFEDGFMVLLRRTVTNSHEVHATTVGAAPRQQGGDSVVRVNELVRNFGDFTAVDRASFDVRRGEVFGLLGPNGAGKTTTFRMLCGLLPATSGTLRVAGVDLRRARASARQQIGYLAQRFSLYSQLSVMENLEFFASTYGLRGRRKRDRINWALEQFSLASLVRLPSGQLPGGYKQRLAMATAMLHEPEVLFLDEPTSGADPLARRDFWKRITIVAEQDVTIIVTTHFMEEAEYCDRVAIMDAGQVLLQGTPHEIRRHAGTERGRAPTMEDAFVAIVEGTREGRGNVRAADGGDA